MPYLAEKRILLVEDEPLIAAMAEDMLQELGAVVVGPAGTIEHALSLASAEQLDVALLDVNIQSSRVDPVAEVLLSRGIPVVFATGYGQSVVSPSSQIPVLEKPYTQESLAAALREALLTS